MLLSLSSRISVRDLYFIDVSARVGIRAEEVDSSTVVSEVWVSEIEMESESHSRMVCLTSSNYVIWKGKKQDLLCTKDLSCSLKGDKSRLVGMGDEDWDILNEKTMATIRQWVNDSVYHHV